ncbi:hypothetical protein QCA50_005615 [Cerrena zonata]|uniref:MYND-type domain-containing protein n=1 Tax=Cerrena zonata TaxID=2478898 RepID=A0AAW0GDK1_9APHY
MENSNDNNGMALVTTKDTTGNKVTDFEWYRTCVNCRVSTAGGNKVKIFSCAGCKTEYYCSRECQKADWRKHKSRCEIVRGFINEANKLRLARPSTGRTDYPPPAQIYDEWRAWRKHFHDSSFAAMVNGFRQTCGNNPKKWHYHFIRITMRRLPGKLNDRPPWARFELTHFDMHSVIEFCVPTFRLMDCNLGVGKYNPETDEWVKWEDRYGQFLVETTCPLLEDMDVPMSACDMTFMKDEFDEVGDVPNWREYFFQHVESECAKWSK